MISRLLKLSLFTCIVFAASVPAEAGILDRILNRSGGRRAGCCQPQAPCAAAPCAPAPCASPSCATTSCQSTPTCLSRYRENLVLINRICATNPQMCAEYHRRAAEAYCECIKDTGTPTCSCGSGAMMRTTAAKPCTHPPEPTLQLCDDFYNNCISYPLNSNCATCWLECVRMSQLNPIVPGP